MPPTPRHTRNILTPIFRALLPALITATESHAASHATDHEALALGGVLLVLTDRPAGCPETPARSSSGDNAQLQAWGTKQPGRLRACSHTRLDVLVV